MSQQPIKSNIIKKIGVIDSGVGGIAILKGLASLPFLQNVSFVYLADYANMPYGNKSQQELIALGDQAIKQLLQEDIDLLVIACHTLSVALYDVISKSTYPIPIINAVDMSIAAASDNLFGIASVGIMATPFTIQSHLHKMLLKSIKMHLNVVEYVCNDLAMLIEHDIHNSDALRAAIKNYLQPPVDIQILVLGCTHYSFVIDILQQLLPNVLLVSAEDSVLSMLAPFEHAVPKRNGNFSVKQSIKLLMHGDASPTMRSLLSSSAAKNFPDAIKQESSV